MATNPWLHANKKSTKFATAQKISKSSKYSRINQYPPYAIRTDTLAHPKRDFCAQLHLVFVLLGLVIGSRNGGGIACPRARIMRGYWERVFYETQKIYYFCTSPRQINTKTFIQKCFSLSRFPFRQQHSYEVYSVEWSRTENRYTGSCIRSCRTLKRRRMIRSGQWNRQNFETLWRRPPGKNPRFFSLPSKSNFVSLFLSYLGKILGKGFGSRYIDLM